MNRFEKSVDPRAATICSQAPLGQAATPPRGPHIGEQLVKLEGQVEALGNLLYQLREKLTPVLREEPAMAQARDTDPQPYLVPLADVLNTRCEALGDLTKAVHDMLERLEL